MKKAKKKAIQSPVKVGRVRRTAARVTALEALEKAAEKEFRLAVNRAMKQYKNVLKNLSEK